MPCKLTDISPANLSDEPVKDSVCDSEQPLFHGLHAGFPAPVGDEANSIDLTCEMVRHPESTFYARIAGDSMQDAGIFDGDIVVIDHSLEARDGNFVAAFIDGEFAIKEFRSDPANRCAWLIAHNPKYPPIRVTADNDFAIWGVVTHNVHPLTNS